MDALRGTEGQRMDVDKLCKHLFEPSTYGGDGQVAGFSNSHADGMRPSLHAHFIEYVYSNDYEGPRGL